MRTLRTPAPALRSFLPRACAAAIFGMASVAYCAAPVSDAPNGMPPVLALTAEQLVLTPVPEPSTWLTLASGVGGLIGLQRFRRKTRA